PRPRKTQVAARDRRYDGPRAADRAHHPRPRQRQRPHDEEAVGEAASGREMEGAQLYARGRADSHRRQAVCEEPWRARTRAALPQRVTETLERGRELVKAAKGLR